VGITRQVATIGEAARGAFPYWLLLLATLLALALVPGLATALPEMMR
jgi:TRAP-type C4-dicarboxylate transport system permease large subunit